MTRWLTLAAVVTLVGGCGTPADPPAPAAPTKTITWEQFRAMPAEEQADPYTLNNLDDNARKKFDEMVKKQKR